MGGVIEASKSSRAETSSATPAQGAGTTFFTGDSDAQDEEETAVAGSDANAPACNPSTEAALEDPKTKDESTPEEDGAPSAVKGASPGSTGSSQNKEGGISGCGASAPKDVNENTAGAPEPSKAPATTSAAASPSVQSTDATRGAMPASSAAVSADTSVKTESTSGHCGATSNSNLRDVD